MRLKTFLVEHYDVAMRVLSFIYTSPCQMNVHGESKSHVGCDFCKLSGTFMIQLIVQEYYDFGNAMCGGPDCLPANWGDLELLPIAQTHPSKWREYPTDSHFFCSMGCHSRHFNLVIHDEESGWNSRMYNHWRTIELYTTCVLGIEPHISRWDIWWD